MMSHMTSHKMSKCVRENELLGVNLMTSINLFLLRLYYRHQSVFVGYCINVCYCQDVSKIL